MEASAASDLLIDALTDTMAYILIERSRKEVLLGKQRFELSGCTADDCAVRMGKMLNVQAVIIGSLSKLGEKYYIHARMVNVETGAVLISETVDAESMNGIPAACAELAARIAAARDLVFMRGIETEPLTPAAKLPEKQPPANNKGTLHIESSLPKTKVFINNEEKGHAPLSISLSTGTYTVKLVKNSLYWEDSVVISSGSSVSISPQLITAPGELSIISKPAGAQASVDNKPAGTTPFRQTLPAGSYSVELVLNDHYTFSEKISVSPNKTTRLNIHLRSKSFKERQPTRIGIGLHYPGVSVRVFSDWFTGELKTAALEKISMTGIRAYYNFNPYAKTIYYLGLEGDTISGETSLQKIQGTAGGLFIGMETFAAKKISILFDIGYYSISLKNTEFTDITASGEYIVGNIGVNLYFN